jgi:DNA-binding transcriptional ArsR family regulator
MTERKNTSSSETENYWQVSDERVVVPTDDLFRALSKAPRRRVLYYLLETPETTAEELADVLVGWHATESELVGPTDREQISLVLRHVHLPMLAQAGFVQYDVDDGSVVRRELTEATRDVVRNAIEYEKHEASSTFGPDT